MLAVGWKAKNKLEWAEVLPDHKDWLHGQMLRPRKRVNYPPNNRCVIVNNNNVFVYYHISLGAEKDSCRLTSINYISGEINWDINFSDLEMNHDYYPTQNFVDENILITLWETQHDYFILTGIDISTGKLIWSFTD